MILYLTLIFYIILKPVSPTVKGHNMVALYIELTSVEGLYLPLNSQIRLFVLYYI